jgi:hypothetical protein
MQTDPWDLIFEKLNIYQNNFDEKPFFITADDIKEATKIFKETGKREPRILCKQDSRD